MKFYLITYNDTQGIEPSVFHSAITTTATIDDWWHYLPNTYIVQTNASSKYLADTIIARCKGLSFLIMKVDMNDFNGVLNKDAWEWINKKIKGSLTLKIKPGTLPPITMTPINRLLPYLQTPPSKPIDFTKIFSSRPGQVSNTGNKIIDDILNGKNSK